MGNFQKYWLQNVGQDFIVLDFFVGGISCGRKRCVREINVSRAWDPVHAGDQALTRETPAKRGRVNRYVTVVLFLLSYCIYNLINNSCYNKLHSPPFPHLPEALLSSYPYEVSYMNTYFKKWIGKHYCCDAIIKKAWKALLIFYHSVSLVDHKFIWIWPLICFCQMFVGSVEY